MKQRYELTTLQVYKKDSCSSFSELEDGYLMEEQICSFQSNDLQEEIVRTLLSEKKAKELEENIEQQDTQSIDQPIVDYDAQMVQLLNSIILNVLPRQNQIQIQEYTQILPVVLQIQSMKSLLKQSRANIDLMCVVDVSGSMEGEKLKLVQNSLRYIQKILKPSDRIALVSFATEAGINLQWTRNIKENKKVIKKAIKNISIRDSTNIASGFSLGLKMIRDRKYKNPVTCMFLLSDGVDDDKDADLRCEQVLQKFKIQDALTIKTFGYGEDHDAKVMNNIANLKGGQFVYVDDIQKVSEHFILAMSGMLSVKAKNTILTVKQLHNQFKIAKIFGDDFLWNKVNDSQYQLNLNYLVDEDKKEFALEMEIPSLKQQELGEESLLQIELQGVFLGLNADFKKTQNLILGFTKTEVLFQPVGLVEINYLRAKAGDRIGQAKELANAKKYDMAIQLLNKIIEEIESSSFKDNKQLVVVLRDLIDIKIICRPQTYERDGEALMLYKQKNHIQRQRSINNSEEWCEAEEEQMDQFRNGNLALSCSQCSQNSIDFFKNNNQRDNSPTSNSFDKQAEKQEEQDIESSPKIIQRQRSQSGSLYSSKKSSKRSSIN